MFVEINKLNAFSEDLRMPFYILRALRHRLTYGITLALAAKSVS